MKLHVRLGVARVFLCFASAVGLQAVAATLNSTCPDVKQALVRNVAQVQCFVEQDNQQKAGGEDTPASVQSKSDTYDSWMSPFKKGPLHAAFTDDHAIQLAVTIISGDDHEDAKSTPDPFRFRNSMITVFLVSTEGTVQMVRTTSRAIQGGGPGKLPDEDFRKLGPLIAHLPDDHSQLPPKGRRMVVQVATSNGIEARAYDRANAPENVLEILRLIGADTWLIYDFPNFQPDQRWEKEEVLQSGIDLNAVGLDQTHFPRLAISPDGNLIAAESSPVMNPTVRVERLKQTREAPYMLDHYTVLFILDAKGATVHEFHEPMNGRGYEFMYAARFTPDGRYLLVMSSIPDVRMYDTSNWNPVDRIPGVPEGVVAYYPSTDWKHGVGVFPSGEITLLDAQTGRKLAQIDPGDDLQYVSFSPDSSRVATVTERKHADGGSEFHLRIWSTATGDLIHELMPLEATERDEFGQPVWWPDGRYLFSPTREGHFGGSYVVGIWNSGSGRYRGALGGCLLPDTLNPQFLLSGEYGFKQCGYGLLRWNVANALQQIGEFEKSLVN